MESRISNFLEVCSSILIQGSKKSLTDPLLQLSFLFWLGILVLNNLSKMKNSLQCIKFMRWFLFCSLM